MAKWGKGRYDGRVYTSLCARKQDEKRPKRKVDRLPSAISTDWPSPLAHPQLGSLSRRLLQTRMGVAPAVTLTRAVTAGVPQPETTITPAASGTAALPADGLMAPQLMAAAAGTAAIAAAAGTSSLAEYSPFVPRPPLLPSTQTASATAP